MSHEERRGPGGPAQGYMGEESDTRRSSMIMLCVTQANQVGTVRYREKYRFLAYSYRLLLAGLVLALGTVAVEFALGA